MKPSEGCGNSWRKYSSSHWHGQLNMKPIILFIFLSLKISVFWDVLPCSEGSSDNSKHVPQLHILEGNIFHSHRRANIKSGIHICFPSIVVHERDVIV
jgi:hypothetical protein